MSAVSVGFSVGNRAIEEGARLHRESRSWFMKVALGCGFDAEHAWSPFNDVEVEFENSLLVQSGFQHPGNEEFLQFSNGVSGCGEIEILS